MTAPERGTATPDPELARRVGHVARALVAAGRSWSLYPSEHPAVATAVKRLAVAIRQASAGQALSLLSADPETIRAAGGPARAWADAGHPAITVEQIDYAKVLEDPADLAPVVAFEHHLRQDLSGYREDVGHRELNLRTQIVSIADVYDALRSNRVYREGLPSDRIKAIMTQKDSPAFNRQLLRRFIDLIGMYPVGTLVRLAGGDIDG
jgi:hypothetical protein